APSSPRTGPPRNASSRSGPSSRGNSGRRRLSGNYGSRLTTWRATSSPSGRRRGGARWPLTIAAGSWAATPSKGVPETMSTILDLRRVDDHQGGVPVQESLLGQVGNTPLVRLRRLAEGVPASVWVKIESLNPGGSIK